MVISLITIASSNKLSFRGNKQMKISSMIDIKQHLVYCEGDLNSCTSLNEVNIFVTAKNILIHTIAV